MMNKAACILSLGAALWVGGEAAKAQIVAASGRTVFNQNVMVRCFARLDFFDEPAPDINVRLFAFPCAAVWGFRPNTNLVVVAPFAVLDVNQQLGAEQVSRTSAGFADGLVLVQYDGFYKKNVPKGFTRVGGQFGFKPPTGRSGFTSDAFDVIMTGIFSHVRDRNWFIADSQFTLTTENGQGTKLGNRWNYDFVYKYRMTALDKQNLFVLLEANGEVAGRTKTEEQRVPNTGGHLLFLSPGVEFFPTRRLEFEFSLPIPVVRDLNGPQLEPRLSFIAGIRYLF